MKNKQITVKELQDLMNKRLEAVDGRRYESTEFHEWYISEIGKELTEQGITELKLSREDGTSRMYEIVANMMESNHLWSSNDVAKVIATVKWDRCCEHCSGTALWGFGEGTITSLRVEFRSDILQYTLDEARRFLIEDIRNSYLACLEEDRDEHRAAIKEDERKIKEYRAINFYWNATRRAKQAFGC